MTNCNKVAGALAALAISLAGTAGAAPQAGISLGYDYSSGEYGQNVTTEIEYLPVSMSLTEGSWRAELIVPWIRVTGNGSVVPGPGSPMVFDNFNAGLLGGGGAPASATSTITSSGMGDVIAELGYAVMPADGSFYELTGSVKFGTADENEGLGTGENDYSLRLDGVVGSGAVMPYFTVGYLVTGDGGGFDYRDVPFASAGLMFRMGEGASAGLGYDYRSATVRGSDDQQQASAFFAWRLGPAVSASVSGLIGFTDSSPDYGLGAELSTRF